MVKLIIFFTTQRYKKYLVCDVFLKKKILIFHKQNISLISKHFHTFRQASRHFLKSTSDLRQHRMYAQ